MSAQRILAVIIMFQPAQLHAADFSGNRAGLRDAGEIVIADLPGHEAARAELGCDRTIENAGGRWQVISLKGN